MFPSFSSSSSSPSLSSSSSSSNNIIQICSCFSTLLRLLDSFELHENTFTLNLAKHNIDVTWKGSSLMPIINCCAHTATRKRLKQNEGKWKCKYCSLERHRPRCSVCSRFKMLSLPMQLTVNTVYTQHLSFPYATDRVIVCNISSAMQTFSTETCPGRFTSGLDRMMHC